MVASDEKVREETSNAELLKEPISLSFGAQQLVNEESRGDEVVHPVTACRMQTSLLKVLADVIPRLETVAVVIFMIMSSLSATVSEPEVILVAKGHEYNYILPG